MEELAQSVGNEKMPGEFDWHAATAVDPNTNDAGPFQHLVDSNPALGREQPLSLQGSPLFETTESFFHKLEAAIQSGERPRALHAPASQTRVHSVALPDTNDVIRRFNRDTAWLATSVVGALVFAALMLAVLVQDRHPKAVDLTEKAVQAGGDLLLNANPATLFKGVGLNGKNSTGEISSVTGE